MPTMTRTAWGLDSDTPDLHEWRLHAACRGYDPSWWDLVGRKLTDQNLKAREICDGCPVDVECAAMGKATGSWGVILAGTAHYGGDRARATVDSPFCGETGAEVLAHRASSAPVLGPVDKGVDKSVRDVRSGGAA